MGKINKFANIYDKDGNILRRVDDSTGMLNNYSLPEVEALVDDLSKKIQETPENKDLAAKLKNVQSVLFQMYNSMSKEDLMSRISVLQNAIDEAKSKMTEEENAALKTANDKLDELKEVYSESAATVMDEYVPYTEVQNEE